MGHEGRSHEYDDCWGFYDALVEAGASEDKARAAAVTLATYDDRFNRIEQRLVKVEGRLTSLTWQVSALTVIGLPALGLLWRVAAKVGAPAMVASGILS